MNISTDTNIVLGTPFLYNYYQILNYENNSLGLYLHQFSDSTIAPTGIDERTGNTGSGSGSGSDNDNSLAPWAVALIVISILIIVGAIIAFVVIRRRNQKLGEQLVEYSKLDTDTTTKGKSTL